MGLARNALFNFAGGIAPAMAALLTVPVIVGHLGAAHYGVLVLVLSIVGYFSILDINVTAGSIKFIAEYHARGDHETVGEVFTVGAALYAVIGLVGAGLLFAFARPMAESVFNVPEPIQTEAVAALRWAGVSFLFSQLQTYAQSVLQALQRYDLSGKSESFFGTVASLATVFVVLLGGGLVAIVQARLILSLVNLFWLSRLIGRLLPTLKASHPTWGVVQAMFGFSAYAYLSRLASVSAANSDKLFVGALVDMRALAMYSVPFTLVGRIYGLVFRLAQVMFPTASAMTAQSLHEELQSLYLSATRCIVFLNAALCLLLVALAPELLHYWAGEVFGSEAVFVMICVAGAIFVDSLTNLPSLFNDGLGRPHNTGIAAVLRAAASIGAAYLAVLHWGIAGAAAAQLAVSLVATAATLWYLHGFSLPVRMGDVWRKGYLPSLAPLALAAVAASVAPSRPLLGVPSLLALGVGLSLALGAYGWLFVLYGSQRRRLVVAARSRLGLP